MCLCLRAQAANALLSKQGKPWKSAELLKQLQAENTCKPNILQLHPLPFSVTSTRDTCQNGLWILLKTFKD